MASDPRTAVEAVLQPGEEILWTGAPDHKVMLRTLGKRRKSLAGIIIVIVVIAVIGWNQRDQLGQFHLGGLVAGGQLSLPALAFIGFTALILFLRRRQSSAHVTNLAYGITDRRILILQRGAITDERTPSELKWVELVNREGADGYSDIIWETRHANTGSGSTTTTPLARERARIGFKALTDGPEVMEQIEHWRSRHQAKAIEAAHATLEALTTGDGEPRLKHPGMGLSVVTPRGWAVSVRRKTFPFGKTRLDLNADKWQDPAKGDDWNVVRLHDNANAEVLIEASLSEPVARFDQMAEPKMPDALKKFIKVVDAQEHVTIGGVSGFRVDQELRGKGNTQMNLGESSDKVQFLLRQYVLHDGHFQYHIAITVPKGSDAQLAACEAIVHTLRPCTTLIA